MVCVVWGVLGGTGVVAIIITFPGCRLFKHYWEVLPVSGTFLDIKENIFDLGRRSLHGGYRAVVCACWHEHVY